ncbi:hypothetical protein C8J95_110126 [Elizabethkingia sp. YR214]|uniref:hypothetical protein n=1 Tax=Elizabethkingia sp. YR214 TaxID=2135667 RepID=UPI000D3193D8|nr:hypothetical protein [Elizabethkingia sp. YR214]PUB26772.1 hypothetical protein C8J95_110126 [Elizabethkingia sp. YR214]
MKKHIKLFFAKKIWVYSIFILVLNSCIKKDDCKINDTFIREISKIDKQNKTNVISATPSAAIQLVFVKLNNGNLYATNGLELHNIYVDNYKKEYNTYYSFLKPLLCQESVLKFDQISDKRKYTIFQIDDDVIKNSVSDVEKKYLEKHKDIFLFYPGDYSLNIRYTILYKLYLSNFHITFDDYSGSFRINKINTID